MRLKHRPERRWTGFGRQLPGDSPAPAPLRPRRRRRPRHGRACPWTVQARRSGPWPPPWPMTEPMPGLSPSSCAIWPQPWPASRIDRSSARPFPLASARTAAGWRRPGRIWPKRAQLLSGRADPAGLQPIDRVRQLVGAGRGPACGSPVHELRPLVRHVRERGAGHKDQQDAYQDRKTGRAGHFGQRLVA